MQNIITAQVLNSRGKIVHTRGWVQHWIDNDGDQYTTLETLNGTMYKYIDQNEFGSIYAIDDEIHEEDSIQLITL